MDRLINVKEASEILSVKESTLRSWIIQGRVPHVRLHKLVRFRESDLMKWIGCSEVKRDG